MNKKRLLALLLSATMVIGSTMTVFAAPETNPTGTGTEAGTGTNEGITDTEIYSVTLPTVTANMYDFYLDPDNNIEDTTNTTSRYNGFTPTNTTQAYFKTTSSTMTADSVKCTISNGSYQPIDVTMKVEVKGTTNITIGKDTDVATAKTPAMYMALVTDNNGAGAETNYVPSTAVLEKTFELDDDSADYEKKWNGSDKYVFAKKSTESHADPKLEFNLQVGCNKTSDADWSTAVGDNTSVEVTWSYKKHPTAVAYTDHTDGSAVWSAGVLYLGVDSNNGFSSNSVTVEISVDDGTTYTTIDSSVNANNYVQITWAKVEAVLSANNVTNYKIRVTDGTDRYISSF